MYSMKDRVVFITGASSGIGESCARVFAGAGAKLILAARRMDRMLALVDELGVEAHVMGLDVRDRTSVFAAVAGIPDEYKNIEVLVNNAGLSRGLSKLHEGDIEDWEEMIDTNIKGLLYVSRAVIPGMVKRGAGHVINISSIAGEYAYPGGNVYCATKAAVKMLTKCMKLDLLGTPVRVTCINPGMLLSEFSIVRYHGDEERADKTYEGVKPLEPVDIADAVFFAATRPPHVDVNDMTVMTTAQATTMVIHRDK